MVDDAIVVVEVVHAKLGLGLQKLTYGQYRHERDFKAIISITLVMVLVFVPVIHWWNIRYVL